MWKTIQEWLSGRRRINELQKEVDDIADILIEWHQVGTLDLDPVEFFVGRAFSAAHRENHPRFANIARSIREIRNNGVEWNAPNGC